MDGSIRIACLCGYRIDSGYVCNVGEEALLSSAFDRFAIYKKPNNGNLSNLWEMPVLGRIHEFAKTPQTNYIAGPFLHRTIYVRVLLGQGNAQLRT